MQPQRRSSAIADTFFVGLFFLVSAFVVVIVAETFLPLAKSTHTHCTYIRKYEFNLLRLRYNEDAGREAEWSNLRTVHLFLHSFKVT